MAPGVRRGQSPRPPGRRRVPFAPRPGGGHPAHRPRTGGCGSFARQRRRADGIADIFWERARVGRGPTTRPGGNGAGQGTAAPTGRRRDRRRDRRSDARHPGRVQQRGDEFGCVRLARGAGILHGPYGRRDDQRRRRRDAAVGSAPGRAHSGRKRRAPVRAWSCSKPRPRTISSTTKPRGVTSSTARFV